MPLSTEEDSLRKTPILFYFLSKNYFPLGVGVMKFTMSCLFTVQILHTKFGQDWLSSSWEDVNARRTRQDARRATTDQPIAMGHLSDSGDLKINMR